MNLELLRYPFHDDELWALTFMKKGTIFVCVNSDLALCKQLKANAFAGLLLMPEPLLREQISLFGLGDGAADEDSVLTLMALFAMPFKAVVLRLYECGVVSRQQAERLLDVASAEVSQRILLTGKAKRWQLDGKGTVSFETLLEKAECSFSHEYVTDSREKEDRAYISELKKKYGMM